MWKLVEINVQNIECDTGKAILIKMPNKSEYAGYKFWYPSKLIRSGKNSYSNSLGYTNDFTFNLKKYGSGKYNSRDIISEKSISVEEFEEAFEVMNDNIVESKKDNESYLVIEEPKKMNIEIKIEEELKNGN